MADLQEENEQLQKAQLSESEAKNKLRQETSRLTAENMVCVCERSRSRLHSRFLALI